VDGTTQTRRASVRLCGRKPFLIRRACIAKKWSWWRRRQHPHLCLCLCLYLCLCVPLCLCLCLCLCLGHHARRGGKGLCLLPPPKV
jgi:hypothetical protein